MHSKRIVGDGEGTMRVADERALVDSAGDGEFVGNGVGVAVGSIVCAE